MFNTPERNYTDNIQLLDLVLKVGNIYCWKWDMGSDEITPLYPSGFKATKLNDYLQCIHPEDLERVKLNILESKETGTYLEETFRRLRQDGAIEWFMGKGIVLNNNDPKLLAVWVNIKDKTEEYKLTSQRVARLALTAQLCSLRELVSIISHDLSQPLMVVNGYIGGCIRRLENNNDSKESIITALKKANDSIQMAGKLLHQLKDSIRKSELTYEEINLNRLIERAVLLINTDPNYPSIQIEYNLSSTLPLIYIDMIKIKLVILNLLNNAIEAAYEAGVAHPKIRISSWQEGDQIKFSVEDNGIGIESNIENKLFNACINAKSKGIGMGLATCRGILDDHQGTISYKKSSLAGSCFTVQLPLNVMVFDPDE